VNALNSWSEWNKNIYFQVTAQLLVYLYIIIIIIIIPTFRITRITAILRETVDTKEHLKLKYSDTSANEWTC